MMVSHQVDFASQFSISRIFLVQQPRGKHHPIAEEFGGCGWVAMPALHSLGVEVNAFGRETPDLIKVKQSLVGRGIRWRLQPVVGQCGINAVRYQGKDVEVLRAVSPCGSWVPVRAEGEALVASPSRALVIGGSMPSEYAEWWITTAAALGKPVFWNPACSASLDLAGVGVVYVQVSFEEFSEGGRGSESPEQMTARLLASTSAAGMIVTNGAGGAWAMRRGWKTPLHVPAMGFAEGQAVRLLGAGDAHLAGFTAAMLRTSGPQAFEQALHAAALIAALHVRGLPISWCRAKLLAREAGSPADLAA